MTLIKQFSNRISKFCNQLCKKYKNETIVLVSHAGTIDMIFRWAVGIKPNQPWIFELEIKNASITEFEIWPYGQIKNGAPRHTTILRVGDVRHLGSNITEI